MKRLRIQNHKLSRWFRLGVFQHFEGFAVCFGWYQFEINWRKPPWEKNRDEPT